MENKINDRDAMANKALETLMNRCDLDRLITVAHEGHNIGYAGTLIVGLAYAIADAMLAERAK